LQQLCEDRAVDFVDTMVEPSGLLDKMRYWKPHMALVSYAEGSEKELRRFAAQLSAEVRRSNGTLVWIRPPAPASVAQLVRAAVEAVRVPSFHSEHLAIPFGPDHETPSASGYAGWAGAIWRWLR
jgi:hypothetical protein